MYERLTPRLDKVIKLSQLVAREYDQDYVGTEHLFLAIVREGTGMAVEILRSHDIDEPTARAAVDKLIRASLEDTWVFGRLPGTPHFRNVMAVAIEQARSFGSKVVCTEHMLLALAMEPGSTAQSALLELNLTADRIREEITRRLGGPAGSGGGEG